MGVEGGVKGRCQGRVIDTSQIMENRTGSRFEGTVRETGRVCGLGFGGVGEV